MCKYKNTEGYADPTAGAAVSQVMKEYRKEQRRRFAAKNRKKIYVASKYAGDIAANVENAIRKTPKWYQRDWCEVADEGARFENLVACHLLKAVDMWNDLGLGDYALHYVRNKAKEEVDFLVAKDGRPWFLVEAKLSDARLSPALAAMQEATGAAHAFQVVRDLPYVDADAFSRRSPVAVSARSFLSQLF